MATCSTCRHFFAEAGACRRFPPQLVVLPQMSERGPALTPLALFPNVNPTTSVCGEHQVVESA